MVTEGCNNLHMGARGFGSVSSVTGYATQSKHAYFGERREDSPSRFDGVVYTDGKMLPPRPRTRSASEQDITVATVPYARAGGSRPKSKIGGVGLIRAKF